MKTPTKKFRRGDTSTEHPGKAFFQYKIGKEYWTTTEQFRLTNIRNRVRAKKYYDKYPERQKAYQRKWLSKPGSLEAKKRSYNNWVKKPSGKLVRRSVSLRHRKTINGTICNRVRSRISVALRNGHTKSASTLELIGCSISEFRTHLESQFSEGMSWKNMGSWEIDHRVPLSSFNLADPEQQKLAFNLHNCRPMWKPANRQKSDKIDGELFRGRDYRKLNIIPFKAA